MIEDFMEADHASIGGLLRRFELTCSQSDRVQAFELLDLVWARLAVHIRAEHLYLFPVVLNALANGPGEDETANPSPYNVREAIDRLHEDHNFFMHELAEAVVTTRELSRIVSESIETTERMEAVRRKVSEVANRLEEHNSIEELEIYGLPLMTLDVEAQTKLDHNLRRELNNMPPRFERALTRDRDIQ